MRDDETAASVWAATSRAARAVTVRFAAPHVSFSMDKTSRAGNELRPSFSADSATDSRRIAPSVNAPGGTVLVVDDDASIRFLCRINLELDGWEVREAESVAQAREALAGEAVRVVLLDVRLGEESGVVLFEEIKRDHPDVRIALLTGTVDTSTLDGATPEAVIPKPFTLEELLGTVRGIAG